MGEGHGSFKLPRACRPPAMSWVDWWVWPKAGVVSSALSVVMCMFRCSFVSHINVAFLAPGSGCCLHFAGSVCLIFSCRFHKCFRIKLASSPLFSTFAIDISLLLVPKYHCISIPTCCHHSGFKRNHPAADKQDGLRRIVKTTILCRIREHMANAAHGIANPNRYLSDSC
jgi:hypothetical protein